MLIVNLLNHFYLAYLGVVSRREPVGVGDILLDSRYGFVNNESFVYFYLQHQGNVVITLTSNYGDADLYVSQAQLYPTYKVDSYDFHSATCGVDVVELSDNDWSGVTAIGIYGHPFYLTSTYTLEILAKNVECSIKLDDNVPTLQMTTAGKKNKSKGKDKDIVRVFFKSLRWLFWFLEII